MAGTVKNWQDSQPPQVNAVDLNGFKEEQNNLIVGSGQVLNTGDTQQSQKAVSAYAAGGDFYTDVGVVNSYQMQVIGSKLAPPAIFTGLRVRFIPINTNTAAAIITGPVGYWSGPHTIVNENGGALTGGEITAGELTELFYNGSNFQLTSPTAIVNAGKKTARTLTPANGGLEIDNQLTGTGFERALTFSDNYSIGLAADFVKTNDSSLTGVFVPENILPGIYKIHGLLRVNMTPNGGSHMRMEMNTPANGSDFGIRWSVLDVLPPGSSKLDLFCSTELFDSSVEFFFTPTTAAFGDYLVEIIGTFEVLGTDRLELSFAQAVSHADPSILRRGTWLTITRLAP